MENDIKQLLNEGETVVTVWRRHPINLLPATTSVVVLIITLAGCAYSLGRYQDAIQAVLPLAVFQVSLLLIAGLAIFIGLAALYIYGRNALVLTSASILHLQQLGLFNYSASKLNLANIEDVTSRRVGILATLLNFGDLSIESAGEQANFTFAQAPNPSQMVEDINRAHQNAVNTRRTIREPGAAATTDPTTPSP